jgi:amino acid adenylation domain-containing protein
MPTRSDIQDIYPLTPLQEGMLFHTLRDQELGHRRANTFCQQMTFRIRGKLLVDLFVQSWNQLLARHDILRTVFNYTSTSKPLQIVLKVQKLDIDYHDTRHLSAPERDVFRQDYIAQDRLIPFDLSQGPLMRLGVLQLADDDYQIVWSFHHIILDGWCIQIIQEELLAIYQALSRGQVARLAPVPPYSAYVKWLQAQPHRAAAAFWQAYIGDYSAATELPKSSGARRWQASSPQTRIFELTRDMTRELTALAVRAQVTLSTVFQCAWGVLLAKYNDADDVVFGMTVSSRPPEIKGIEQMVGLFLHTIPMRLRIEDGLSLETFLRRTQDKTIESQRYAYYPLADIQALSPAGQRLITHNFLFENYPLDERYLDAVEMPDTDFVIDHIQVYIPQNYDFVIAVHPGDPLKIRLLYQAQRFDPLIIEHIEAHLVRILEAFIHPSVVSWHDIDILSPGEKSALLRSHLASRATPIANTSVAAVFEAQAAAYPERTALVCGTQRMTYAELDRKANMLANKLLASYQVDADTRIGVMFEPSVFMCIALLACIKSGSAFIPLDAVNPVARINHMIQDSGMRLLLCDPYCAALDMAFQGTILCLDDAFFDAHPLDDHPPVRHGDPGPLYIIYTSGTTGVPKGVIVGHASLLNYVDWLADTFAIGPHDSSVLMASVSFDLGYTSLFGTLLRGATLHIVPDPMRHDPDVMLDYLADHAVTYVKTTPSFFHMLLAASHTARWRDCAHLRLVILGGEELRLADVQTFVALKPDTQIVNHYGPTEATVGCIAHVIDTRHLDLYQGVTILGKPIRHANVYLLDRSLRPVPTGVSGELCIGGPVLAHGYTQVDDATSQRFLPDPFVAGERIFRTGDFAHWCVDGHIAFEGRRDDQVKIRGYRVELGEIETALEQHTHVERAVVLPTEARAGARELIAFLLLKQSQTDLASLRKTLSDRLPPYMIPSRFFPITRLPLTPNGKIDRDNLLTYADTPMIAADTYTAPASELERQLADIWTAVLACERVGVHDDFFALGGHSIKAVYILAQVRRQLQINLKVRDLFDYPTVRQLAQHIAEATGRTSHLLSLKRTAGAARTIFCLPPHLGTSTLYKEMAVLLDTPCNAYGLQCKGFDEDEPFDPDIPQMAAFFRDTMQRFQVSGPYLLLGYSMGVIGCLEVARQLEAQGERATLILVDGLPNRRGGPARPDPRRLSFEALREEPYWKRLLDILTSGLPDETLHRIESLANHNARIAYDYRFEGQLQGDIYCIEARYNDPPVGMETLRSTTTGHFEHHVIPGDHYSIFHPPYFTHLLTRLKTVLTQIGVQPS